ncbi:DUF5329 domain-containing protein [Massilia sp. IC2-477]|uniref:DUF5329 domain-containing protein n=1 Tax=Massilia sp. IC2-477 TaxID=2887198 RepID=UPI001D1146B8|nr:DUF5329 domain-containing protein [Massilia sp. IC2-477]MCC2957012.1 DUF5329 domain-containing protein [Massilia sp. IC2-477]
MPTIRFLASSVLAAVCLSANAAPTPPAIRAEIDGLMAKMSNSGCEFERNGSWHSGADARKHLLRKLDYIEGRRETLQSTEQFIDLAASKSSFSGRPYRVKCSSGEALPSRDWLHRELKTLRGTGRQAG